MDCAQRLTGKDVVAVAAKMDRSARPTKLALKGRTVSFRATLEEGSITVRNVVGVLPGSDPSLADEYVLVGAHYDHIGVGPRGRIGFGADDNASGTSALLEIVGAMAAARPRRSVLFCAFSGEEKGLLGSAAIAAQPPVPTQQIVAMVNLDMVGRGETREVLLMGFKQNPDMEKVVRRASRLSRTGIRKLIEKNDVGLFQRSDHYSFHKVGIPVVFFLEGPLAANRDYHSFRDTADKLDMEKVANIARLAFNTAWLLANDDERLPPPER
jgi:Zn-dependent M28 family amino/carboxypeptidase